MTVQTIEEPPLLHTVSLAVLSVVFGHKPAALYDAPHRNINHYTTHNIKFYFENISAFIAVPLSNKSSINVEVSQIFLFKHLYMPFVLLKLIE